MRERPDPTPGERLDRLLRAGSLDLSLPGGGATALRWSVLAGWGRADLPLARLAEGHVDAVAILRELGAAPAPGACYGVWAARPAGQAPVLRGETLSGTARYCSGAHVLGRALVVADAADGTRLVDVDLGLPGVEPLPSTWATEGMRDSDTVDVVFHDVPVTGTVGPPGAYTERPGFWWGGAGVAAVWLGGGQGVVDVLRAEGPRDPHELAHLGALHAALQAAEALLQRTAAEIDADPTHAHRTAVMTVRSAIEQACRRVLDVAPRVAGVGGLTGGPWLARHLADLGIYLRQHHGEADLAALGAELVERA